MCLRRFEDEGEFSKRESFRGDIRRHECGKDNDLLVCMYLIDEYLKLGIVTFVATSFLLCSQQGP